MILEETIVLLVELFLESELWLLTIIEDFFFIDFDISLHIQLAYPR